MTSLRDSGAISKRLFTLYLTLDSSQSKAWFGGYDSSYFYNVYTYQEMQNKTSDQLIAWMDVKSSSYWQVDLNSATVGNFEVQIQTKYLVVDSGASLNYLPTSDFNALHSQIFDSSNNAQCS